MDNITRLYDIVNDFDDRYHRTMTSEEFELSVIHGCKSDIQRAICKDLLEIRPGWVNNIEIAAKMERFILDGTLWGVEKATQMDLVNDIINDHAVEQLDAIAAVAILNKHKDAYQKQVADFAKRRNKQ